MQHANSKKSNLIFKLLAEEIRLEREKQNKSIRILAYEYDLQASLISRLENCVNEPKIISIFSICEALGITPSELFRRVESKLPPKFSIIDD